MAVSFVPPQLDRILKQGRAIRRHSPPERLHKLRIEIKRLRYLLEYLQEPYGEPLTRATRRLRTLQNTLGDHQDAEVASERLHDMIDNQARGLPARTMFVIGLLSERYAHRAAELRDGFAPLFERVRGKRWRRLRNAMRAGAGAAVGLRPATGPTPPAAEPRS